MVQLKFHEYIVELGLTTMMMKTKCVIVPATAKLKTGKITKMFAKCRCLAKTSN